MSELQSAMASMVNIVSIVKGAVEARDWAKLSEASAKFNDQIIKTQQAVIDTQSTLSDLVGQLAKAHEKIRELEASAAQKQRHRTEELRPGVFVLLVDESEGVVGLALNGTSESKQYACQRCFAVTGKSILLQFERGSEGFLSKYTCVNCKNVIWI